MANNITILAVGGAGCRIIREFAGNSAAGNYRMLALDSDVESLQKSGLPETSLIQAGKLWRSGRGCGGDIMAGQMAVANVRKELTAALEKCDTLLVVAGLGGGLASGGLPVIFGAAAKMHLNTVLLCTLPFAMEGYQRRKLADDQIVNDILPVADAVIALPNDLLFSTMDAEVSLAEAFHCSDVQMAYSLLSLGAIVGGGNLFSADFAAFTGVLKRRHAMCAFGAGVVDAGDDAPEKVMEKLLESPFLGGSEALKSADAVAFSLLGGPELSLGNAKAALDLAGRQVGNEPEKIVLLGAANAEELAGKLQLSALAVRYLDKNNGESGRSGKRKSGNNRHFTAMPDEHGGEQLALPNLIAEEKGIMENTTPVIVDGEDLDVPAFKRKGLIIDLGK